VIEGARSLGVRGHVRTALIAASLAVTIGAVACGSGTGSVFPDGGGGSGGTGGNGGNGDGSIPILSGGDDGGGSGGEGGSGHCTGIACNIKKCGTGSTTISGTIYDPALANPLYNIVAYVPNSTPKPFPPGAACTPCNALYTGDPIATGLTDATGHFTIPNAPDGKNIPLVVQVGKWRQQFVIPSVTACTDNPQPDKTLSLPKNHMVGDIPDIAISTGGSDTLECLLSRIGVDSAEYVPGSSTAGRLHVYQGGSGYGGQFGVVPNTSPPAPQSYMSLWDSTTDLLQYDITLLSCEGEETKNTNPAALLAYAAAGGRVFASHFHYAWLDNGPFAATTPLATWTPGANDMGTINADIQTTLPSGGTFPKGVAMQAWLGNVGALTGGELPIQEAKHNADVSAANTLSTPWIAANASADPPNATEYFSFDTPLGAKAADLCGRVVFSDLHVGAASNDNPNMPVPMDCTPGKLSPQEDALEFMLFDLSSCVIPNDQPPTAPPGSPPPK
jgi:hypothetical protein